MRKEINVLLIDDSRAINNRNESLLKSMNLFNEINKYSYPTEALDFIKNETDGVDNKLLPDLIFLDISMPGMDAFAFLDKYSRLDNVVDSDFLPKIIIVSDHLLENRNLDHTNKYKTVGVVDHIKKPMDKEDVLSVLEEHLDKY
jgi:CheY-like chemotaxis protein